MLFAAHFLRPLCLVWALTHAPSPPSPGVPPAGPGDRGAGAALRIEAHHATVAIPAGWSRLDPTLLTRINEAAGASGARTVTYLDGLVPDTQPEDAAVYALLQWEATPTVSATPEEIERTIRANVASMAGAATPESQLRVSEPSFDWTNARVTFHTEQLVGGAQAATHSTGTLGATGILWVHAYVPPKGMPGTVSGPLEDDLRLIAGSARFDPAYAYVAPAGGVSGSDRSPPETRGRAGSSRGGWVVPLVIGVAVALTWVLLRTRKA